MSASNWGKDCGVCHVGGGQMEYDRDMLAYGDPSSTDAGSIFTYRPNRVDDVGTVIPGGIVSTSTNSNHELYGDNKAEVDCLMCHMNGLRTGAAWYKSQGCDGSTLSKKGPADDLACEGAKFDGISDGTAQGTFYDSFNRNIAVSLGYFKQAASAGLGALIDMATGALSNVPASVPGEKISAVPNSDNCAMCHARTNSDSIGLPLEAPQYGGMVTGYGNFFRITEAGKAFDFDKIAADGTCAGDCDNDTQWNEFGCKTGMGKRAQKSGVGTQDRFGFGVCFGCAAFNAMNGDTTTGWFGGGVCNLPSVQTMCNDKAGSVLQGGAGQWMGILENPATGMTPTYIAGKMSDTDVHDAAGMKCATCHYTVSGDFDGRTISAGATSFTYSAITGIQKMDHQLAQGWSTLEKANDVLDGTVTCEGCHTERTHPNLGSAPNPDAPAAGHNGHAGFPAVHFQKIDCRTCHIPAVYASPGRLLFRDWTAGGYRQTDGANGNANHFDFAFNFSEGSAIPMAPLKVWFKVQEPSGAVTKIVPGLPSMLPIWVNGGLSNLPLMTRDVTAAAARIAAANRETYTPGADPNAWPAGYWDLRLNGTNEHPGFQGFHLTDPLKIESAAKIAAMRAELATAGAGLATHSQVADAKLNLGPFFFDPSHGITSRTLALGANGCTDCHSNTSDFFNAQKDMLKNGFMQMADYDCGGADGETSFILADYPGNMCGTFDAALMGGDEDGTCDAAELTACKVYIGRSVFAMFGMPSDIAGEEDLTPGQFPIDGIDMMQMQAIREGATEAGCNPIYSFFGLPNGTVHGEAGTNGCIPTDYYTREEIRKHYKKNLQQVQDGGANKVFGSIKVGSSLAAHDLGATCIDSSGTDTTCTDGGYVKTTVNQKLLLGYNDTDFAKFTDFSVMQETAYECATCHTASASNHHSGTCTDCHDAGALDGRARHDNVAPSTTNASCLTCHSTAQGTSQAVSMSTLNHSTGATSDCTDCHTETGATIVITATCGQCHTSGPGPYKPTAMLTALAKGMHQNNQAPVISKGTVTISGYTVSFMDASTDADGTTNTVTVNWGDGRVDTQNAGTLFSRTYSRARTYKIYHSVTDGSLSASEAFTATVPTTTNVTVTISGATAGKKVSALLKLNGHTKKVARRTSEGDVIFNKVRPGDYTINVYSYGKTFPVGTAVTVDNDGIITFATGTSVVSAQ